VTRTYYAGFRRATAFCFAGAVLFVSVSSSAHAQFFATRSYGGEMLVTDAAGTPVDVVASDPVGERPPLCPDESYYVAELPTDISELVLTDCATDEGRYTVEMQTSGGGGS
jgi:hypothetical protein